MAGPEGAFTSTGEVGDDGLLLDAPDPVDLLLAMTEEPSNNKERPLDFVRARIMALRKENKQLKERIGDLEQTLSIVQTAQSWAVEKEMTPDQIDKMREIKELLEKARRAKEEMANFSKHGRSHLYEQLRSAKLALKRERESKAEMKDRLLCAFDHGQVLKKRNELLTEQIERDHSQWQTMLRDVQNRHRSELRRLTGGESAVRESDRNAQLSQFGEHVMHELTALQEHLREVRQETVDTIEAPDGDGDADGGGDAGGYPDDSFPLSGDDDLPPVDAGYDGDEF